MVFKDDLYFDPETVALLRETLEEAWNCLPPGLQATMQKDRAG